jgi:hypothetical protein
MGQTVRLMVGPLQADDRACPCCQTDPGTYHAVDCPLYLAYNQGFAEGVVRGRRDRAEIATMLPPATVIHHHHYHEVPVNTTAPFAPPGPKMTHG